MRRHLRRYVEEFSSPRTSLDSSHSNLTGQAEAALATRLISTAVAERAKVPADRADFASRCNDNGAAGRHHRSASRCNDGGSRRHHHRRSIVVAGTEHAAVTAEAASSACVGRRKCRNARDGDKECERQISGHEPLLGITYGVMERACARDAIFPLQVDYGAVICPRSAAKTYPTPSAPLARIFPGSTRVRFGDAAHRPRISWRAQKLFRTFVVKTQAALEPSRSNHHFRYIPESASSRERPKWSCRHTPARLWAAVRGAASRNRDRRAGW